MNDYAEWYQMEVDGVGVTILSGVVCEVSALLTWMGGYRALMRGRTL
jgi:hypothetical protein